MKPKQLRKIFFCGTYLLKVKRNVEIVSSISNVVFSSRNMRELMLALKAGQTKRYFSMRVSTRNSNRY